jgi:hypothetical protein
LTPASDATWTDRFRAVHAPAYGVWATQPRGERLHRALAEVFAGEALTQAYLDHERSLRRLATTEGRVDVQDIRYRTVEVLDRGWSWATVEAEWEVSGTIRHGTGEQAHVHRRTNVYRAAYRISEVDGGFRIVESRMRDIRRLEVGPRETSATDLQNPLDMLPQAGVP